MANDWQSITNGGKIESNSKVIHIKDHLTVCFTADKVYTSKCRDIAVGCI